MISYLKRYARNFDYPLFFVYLALCFFGLIMIYSASMGWAVLNYGWDPDHFFNKQKTNLLLCIPVFFITAFFPYKHYKNKVMMQLMLLVMFTLLFLVHIIGVGGESGSQSWIDLGFNIQPSEIAKLVIVLYFAGIFAKKSENGTLDKLNESVGPPLIVLFFVFVSIMMETDVGNTMIISFVAISVIAASGIKFKSFSKIIGLIGIVIVAGLFAIYMLKDALLTDRRRGRLEAFFNPFDYEQGFGYQIVNGYIAIGSGGLTGLGLGNSNQKYGYLPEPHTDFIMAIIAEELGLIGVLIVLCGLFFIVFKAISIALSTKDSQARMIAAGIGSIIGFQTFINLGGMLGIIPLTGVPLPFISYGGTSIIILSAALGILMNVSMFVKHEKNRQ
ncbi:FtsW/RodA/SpoVE family cell cycle protein [Psychrobacillus psychrodurans]|uniref:Probable peptidoglycan glycosyltransferase FtsW n=1 Tax=Psychrobacillus psychrodurans TaxID=126157 RepID=A0A9X3L7U0_9BACI|nr:FtsW/RodA/SpoVE family cell cycle protein [Psychrobacillus psychrodurans]MCZ8532916.1 FtsW/RodA/SpoVE family cell cycle protein [Psychrobacillus psychrodurans]